MNYWSSYLFIPIGLPVCMIQPGSPSFVFSRKNTQRSINANYWALRNSESRRGVEAGLRRHFYLRSQIQWTTTLMNKPQAFRRRLRLWKQTGVYGQSIAHSFWMLYIISYVLLFKVEIPQFFTNNRCWLVTKVTFKPLFFFHEAPAWISGQQPENVRTWWKKL